MSATAEAIASSPALDLTIEEKIKLQFGVEQFLYEEAATLDNHDYEKWLTLLSEDIHYWMPIRRTVSAKEKHLEFTKPGEMSFFDDDFEMLKMRVIKTDSGYSWSEDPPSRTRHFVSNVRILNVTEEEVELDVVFHLYRTRLATEVNTWAGRRHEILQRTDSGFLLKQRHIYLDQTLIKSTNLSTIF